MSIPSTQTAPIINIYWGNYVPWNISYKDSAGVAISLVGKTILFTAKTLKTDPDSAAIIKKAVSSHVNAAAGLSFMALDPVDTQIVMGTKTRVSLFFDFTIISTGTANPITFNSGILNVDLPATQRTSA